MKLLVTGGAGFIGSALVRYLIGETDAEVVNFDKLTYAANLASLGTAADNPRYHFIKGDICDRQAVDKALQEHRPDGILHLAAESHVDRSIDGPAAFLETNIMGTYQLLDAANAYWQSLEGPAKTAFRFQHISTDEVFGSIEEGLFTEESQYQPNSPYAASKASSDHLVRAWHRTYGLPVVITNCSNNYGPYQFPEKLIPLMIIKAMAGEALPIYGKGDNVRDWLHVEDHVRALWLVFRQGRVGETYAVGGRAEMTNLEVVERLCTILDEVLPHSPHCPHAQLKSFVPDRPGHDRRYAIDSNKIEQELGWRQGHDFESGLRQTVGWYLERRDWWEPILAGRYGGERLGVGNDRSAARQAS